AAHTASASPAGGQMGGEGGETFAADRNQPGSVLPESLVQGIRSGDTRRLPTIADPTGQMPAGRAHRNAQGPAMVSQDQRQKGDEEFPLPYMLGGPRPKIPLPAATGDPQRTTASLAKGGKAPSNTTVSRAEPGATPRDAGVPVPVPAGQGAAKTPSDTSPG